MSSGNGHSSPAVVEATRRLEACRRRLDTVDSKLRDLKAKLEQATVAVTTAQEKMQSAEAAMATGTAGAERQWQAARAFDDQVRAKVRGLQQLIAEQERLRTLPDQEYQTASSALSKAVFAEDLDRARRELATANHALNQAYDAQLLAQNRYAKAKEQVFQLEKQQRDAEWRETQRISREHWQRANPGGVPGFERVRNNL